MGRFWQDGIETRRENDFGVCLVGGRDFVIFCGGKGGLFLPKLTFFRGLFFLQLWANMGKYPSTPLPPCPNHVSFFFFFPLFSFSRLNVRVFLCKNEDIFSYKLFFFFNVIGGHESKFIQTPFSIHSFSFSTKQKSFPPPPKPFQSPPFSIPHFSTP